MKQFLKLLHFSFLPRNADFALLVLRLWAGGSMLLLHGWGKLVKYSEFSESFGDPIGLGPKPSLILAIFAEVVCSALIAIGLLTRFAALVLGITMGVAFFMVHNAVLKGPGSGELAFIYLAVMTTIFIAGPGKYSLDASVGGAGK